MTVLRTSHRKRRRDRKRFVKSRPRPSPASPIFTLELLRELHADARWRRLTHLQARALDHAVLTWSNRDGAFWPRQELWASAVNTRRTTLSTALKAIEATGLIRSEQFIRPPAREGAIGAKNYFIDPEIVASTRGRLDEQREASATSPAEAPSNSGKASREHPVSTIETPLPVSAGVTPERPLNVKTNDDASSSGMDEKEQISFPDDMTRVLAAFGIDLRYSQLKECSKAYGENRLGFGWCVAEASNGYAPPGLLTSLIREGEHMRRHTGWTETEWRTALASQLTIRRLEWADEVEPNDVDQQ